MAPGQLGPGFDAKQMAGASFLAGRTETEITSLPFEASLRLCQRGVAAREAER